METTSKQLKKRGSQFVAIGCLLIILGSAATFLSPTADFWRGFIHGLSIIANLCGIVFLIIARRYAKKEGRLRHEEEVALALESAETQHTATEA